MKMKLHTDRFEIDWLERETFRNSWGKVDNWFDNGSKNKERLKELN